MNNIELIPRIKELFAKGQNIIEFIKGIEGRASNTIEDILISYDFQSGSYIDFINKNPEYNDNYTSAIAEVFSNLGDFNSVLEVGAGEATTLGNVALKLNKPSLNFLGFDISWSRIHCGQTYLRQIGAEADLFVADLFNIPLSDSSIDVVYTSHSIEPNGGREKEALEELYRVSKKYLVLLEPTNEFASEEGKSRMKKHGYVQNLANVIKDLKYDLVEYRLFNVSSNPLNPTGLYIIKKEDTGRDSDSKFCCPLTKKSLEDCGDHFFCRESLISYPKVMGIPCLFSSYGILTSKHD
ncbi:class I SAM-dependent methyltransferase [Daejeonella sp.]|uniref:class I SAM-dependent methyltransferase n=1 Tax=Daejeonella sp. TaxID=2805397 RepID=UPI0030C35D90